MTKKEAAKLYVVHVGRTGVKATSQRADIAAQLAEGFGGDADMRSVSSKNFPKWFLKDMTAFNTKFRKLVEEYTVATPFGKMRVCRAGDSAMLASRVDNIAERARSYVKNCDWAGIEAEVNEGLGGHFDLSLLPTQEDCIDRISYGVVFTPFFDAAAIAALRELDPDLYSPDVVEQSAQVESTIRAAVNADCAARVRDCLAVIAQKAESALDGDAVRMSDAITDNLLSAVERLADMTNCDSLRDSAVEIRALVDLVNRKNLNSEGDALEVGVAVEEAVDTLEAALLLANTGNISTIAE